MAVQFVGLGVAPQNEPLAGPHNDIHFDATGNLVLVTDNEAIGQHIRQRIMFWKGEWFLNREAGLDWTRYILGRPPSEIGIAEAIFKREVLQTPGVRAIDEISVRYDRATRGFIVDLLSVSTILDDDVLDVI